MNQRDAYVIWSFEHDGWWRPGGHGYTRELAQAGRYAEAEAAAIVAEANQYCQTIYEIAVPEAVASAEAIDQALVQTAATEIEAASVQSRVFEVLCNPLVAFYLVGILQLASRHPQLEPNAQDLIDRVVADARTFSAGCPAVLTIIARGADPDQDR